MLENISIWFNSMDLLRQIFWVCAIISSLFFAVQVVLILIGIDNVDMDFDADTLDLGGGFSLLTIKNLIHFFLGLGWAGVSLWDYIDNRILLTIVAFLVGALMVALFIFLFKKMMKLESQGNYDPQECLGTIAEVYIPIPENKSGNGKVQLSIKGSVKEFTALTQGERLATGTKVRVTEVIDHSTVIVEKI